MVRLKPKGLIVAGILAVGFLVLPAIYLFWLIRVSNPPVGVGGSIASLAKVVKVEQDALGVPTIRGESVADIYRGQGWVTARDRFFQMDLLRRRSAGKLSEILGEKALTLDIFHRRLGLSRVASKAMASMEENKRRYLRAYAQGVNAYLQSGTLPFEIRLLRYHPEPWTPEDSLLVVLAMFLDLDFNPQYLSERALTLLYEKRPKELADFLTPKSGFLDTPVLPDQDNPSVSLPKFAFDIRKEPLPFNKKLDEAEPAPGGSNAWALSGKFTSSGHPILAGDPHLDLFAPNLWYRARLEGGSLHVTGVSLPGVPGIVIGSGGDVAWSITYPSGDTLDLVIVREKDNCLNWEESISVRGKKAQVVVVEECEGRPVIFAKKAIRYAIQWTALDAKELAQLESTPILLARNTKEFLQAVSRWKGPVSNFVFATRQGDIGWALGGNFPNRVGFDGRRAAPRDEGHYWNGYLSFERLPKIVNPSSGYIVSANQRMVPLRQGFSHLARVGNNYSNPDRAHRIRQLLEASKGKWTPSDSARVQLDIYSPTGVFYRDILKSSLSYQKNKGEWETAIEELVKDWDGRVSVETPVFPFIKMFRSQVLASMIEPLWGVGNLNEEWLGNERSAMKQWYASEPVLKTLLKERPAYFLVSKFNSYEEAVVSAAVSAARKLVQRPDQLKRLRWGEINRTEILHPFSLALPAPLGRYFSMPEKEVGGALSTPKVAALLYGRFHSASMRMVVDLADVQKSIFNQPGGQSGNFQSPHYSDQYFAWLTGTPVALEPGKTVVIDILRP